MLDHPSLIYRFHYNESEANLAEAYKGDIYYIRLTETSTEVKFVPLPITNRGGGSHYSSLGNWALNSDSSSISSDGTSHSLLQSQPIGYLRFNKMYLFDSKARCVYIIEDIPNNKEFLAKSGDDGSREIIRKRINVPFEDFFQCDHQLYPLNDINWNKERCNRSLFSANDGGNDRVIVEGEGANENINYHHHDYVQEQVPKEVGGGSNGFWSMINNRWYSGFIVVVLFIIMVSPIVVLLFFGIYCLIMREKKKNKSKNINKQKRTKILNSYNNNNIANKENTSSTSSSLPNNVVVIDKKKTNYNNRASVYDDSLAASATRTATVRSGSTFNDTSKR